jgi:hypothetical protein
MPSACLSLSPLYQRGFHWTDFLFLGGGEGVGVVVVARRRPKFCLTAVRNILELVISAEASKCCIYVATLNAFVLLTDTCRSRTIERERIVAFSYQQWLRENTIVLTLCVFCQSCCKV